MIDDLTVKEEADIVLRHMGWLVDFQHAVEMAKVVFNTETVEYGISVSPEGGNETRSTLVMRPHVLTTASHHEICDASDRVHEFLHKINKELYMMVCVNVSFVEQGM